VAQPKHRTPEPSQIPDSPDDPRREWRRRLRRFKRNKAAMASLLVLAVLIVGAIFAPVLATHDPDTVDLFARLAGPSAGHFLGTDDTGRDIFSRLLFGGRITMLVGLVSAFISIMVGVTLGGLAGFLGGTLDSVIMRVTDGMLAIPMFFFLLMIMAVFGGGMTQIILVVGLTSWMPVARVVRGEVLRTKRLNFVEAADALGAPSHRIIIHHVLPQSVPSIIVSATLGVANVILQESALSYLGLGIQPPTASWGNMLNSAQSYIFTRPSLAVWPGLLIFVTVMACNSLGDGIRDALDPTERS
jgi:peptide/nickel transport system permease protein